MELFVYIEMSVLSIDLSRPAGFNSHGWTPGNRQLLDSLSMPRYHEEKLSRDSHLREH